MVNIWMNKSEAGFTFIEVLIALTIMVILASVFLNGVAYSSRAVMLADGRATAEALAKSEIEYIKTQPYKTDIFWKYTITSTTGSRPSGWLSGNPIPTGYSLSVTPSAISGYAVTDMQQVSVNITRGASAQPWMHIDYTLADYWRTP